MRNYEFHIEKLIVFIRETNSFHKRNCEFHRKKLNEDLGLNWGK